MIYFSAHEGFDDVLMPTSGCVVGHPNGVFLVFEYDDLDPDDPGRKERKTILLPKSGALALAEELAKAAQEGGE